MEISRKELVTQIEHARNRLNQSIETGAAYETIYQNSIEQPVYCKQSLNHTACRQRAIGALSVH